MRDLRKRKWKLKNAKQVVERIDEMLRFFKASNMITQGYMCGLVNGFRLLRSEIVGDEPIFERNEVLPKVDKIPKDTIIFLGSDSKGKPIYMMYSDWENLTAERVNGKHGKTENTEGNSG